MTAIGILHFTDLHVGMGGFQPRWPNIQHELLDDLASLQEHVETWDLVLFTGDFAARGTAEEFDEVRALLDKLWKEFARRGSEPLLVPVPGNHDLERPAPSAATLLLQRMWADPAVQEPFWEEGSEYRAPVARAFECYDRWSRDPGVPVLEPQTRGILPGDFSATYAKDGAKLGLLGLNTTFLQLSDGMGEKSLAVDPRQIAAACDPNVPEWMDAHDACLLLTHQPPAWLREDARRALNEIPGRFAAHLCGHLHAPRASAEAAFGSSATNLLQGASLFGLEGLGRPDETRIHGYSACRLEFEADRARLRVWPRAAATPTESGYRLDRDIRFTLDRRTGQFAVPFEVRRGGDRGVSGVSTTSLQTIADDYEALRERLPSGRPRTERLEGLLAKARNSARLMSPDEASDIAIEWLDDVTSSRHGRHAVALAVSQALSDPEHFAQVLKLLLDPGHRGLRFEQLQALKYLEDVLPNLSTDRRIELTPRLEQLGETVSETSDRGRLIRLLLKRLRATPDSGWSSPGFVDI